MVALDLKQLLPRAASFFFSKAIFERQSIQFVTLSSFHLFAFIQELRIEPGRRRGSNERFGEMMVLNSSLRDIVHCIHDIRQAIAHFPTNSDAILMRTVSLRHLCARQIHSIARREQPVHLLFLEVKTVGVPLISCLPDLDTVLVLEGVSLVVHLVTQGVQVLLHMRALFVKMEGRAQC